MNKTVYLREDEAPIWEKARELSGDKLSPVIVDALKKYIAEKEATSRNFERIVISYNDAEEHGIPKKKAFYGSWVFSPQKPQKTYYENDETKVDIYNLAVTQKGGVVVTSRTHYEDDISWTTFYAFPSFQEAAGANEINHVVRAAMEKVGVPVEELDI